MSPSWQEQVADYVLASLPPADERALRVLEAGCGRAPVAHRLAGRERVEFSCCDLAEPGELPDGAVFHRLDLCRAPLPFPDEHFDAVACTEVLEHLKAQLLALEELARVVRSGGLLVFTLPNFWNVRLRWRYLTTGGLPTGRFFDPKARVWYRDDLCPHITNTTLPVLEYALASQGLRLEAMRVGVNPRRSWPFWPLAAAIRTATFLRRRKTAQRRMLAHTNRWRVLVGGEHVMLVFRKVGFDHVGYEVERLPFV